MKIAVLRGLYLGDLVATTPALRALRRGYPGAEVSLVGLPWAAALAPHLAPWVDRVIPYPGAPGLDGWTGDERELDSFLETMRAQRFDLAVNLHGRGPQSTKLVTRFGARRAAGFANREAPPLNFETAWEAGEHESLKLLHLARAAGGRPAGARPELRVRKEDQRRASALLTGLRGPLALVHPGASVPGKRWPAEGFGRVARGLLASGHAVAVSGAANEKDLARRVCELAPGSMDLAGETDLPALVGLVARASFLIANDTGPAHLAYALQTPSVTLFGPSTDARRWGPLDRTRHTVLSGDPISQISAEAVLRAAEALGARRERLGA